MGGEIGLLETLATYRIGKRC